MYHHLALIYVQSQLLQAVVNLVTRGRTWNAFLLAEQTSIDGHAMSFWFWGPDQKCIVRYLVGRSVG